MRTALYFIGMCATIATATKIYNPEVAMRALHYTAAAYCAKTTLPNWSCGEACRLTPGVK